MTDLAVLAAAVPAQDRQLLAAHFSTQRDRFALQRPAAAAYFAALATQLNDVHEPESEPA
jgi:hypothetical protein